jgi:hypothetical protein
MCCNSTSTISVLSSILKMRDWPNGMTVMPSARHHAFKASRSGGLGNNRVTPSLSRHRDTCGIRHSESGSPLWR